MVRSGSHRVHRLLYSPCLQSVLVTVSSQCSNHVVRNVLKIINAEHKPEWLRTKLLIFSETTSTAGNPVRKAYNLTTFLCCCHEIWEPLTSWNPLGHSKPVTGVLYLYINRECHFLSNLMIKWLLVFKGLDI